MELNKDKSKPILVTGATGYVGGRLVRYLLEKGYKVKAVSRSMEKLKSRDWASHPNIELLALNVLNIEDLTRALYGCLAAYYLVHSMNPEIRDFANVDKIAAQNMVIASNAAKIERIIYLGGLGQESPSLSKHLRSRAEVASILKSGSVPATVFRAAMIIGSGSASFEIMRYLIDRLPILITPGWVRTPTQPIAIRNVLHYLVESLEKKETLGRTFDVGGPDILTYEELMKIYASEAGIQHRWIIPIPVFSPKLSSYWIHLITPIPASIARPLAEGLRNPTVCLNDEIKKIIPQELMSCRQAIRLALESLREEKVETHWGDAGMMSTPEWNQPGDPSWAGGTTYRDERSIIINALPSEVWNPLVRIGGRTGWYYGDWLLQLRGLLDFLFGGIGFKRGRRVPSQLRVGDVLDFWRVISIEPAKYILLKAEMKLPGYAFLEFKLEKNTESSTKLTQIATFIPSGLSGILYWYSVSPLHNLVFNGMIQGIGHAAERFKQRQIKKNKEFNANF